MKKSGKIIAFMTAISAVSGVFPAMINNAYAVEGEGYTWVVEPSIQAEDINPAYEWAFGVNYGHFLEQDYHIIKQDDKYGIIDFEGNIVIEPTYKVFRSDANNHIELMNDFSDEDLFCMEYGKIDDGVYGGRGCSLCEEWLSTTVCGNFGCYDKATNSFARIGNGKPSNGTETYGSFMAQNSESILKGDYLETAQLATFNNDANKSITLHNKFGIVSNGNIILDFDYDSALTFKDGITALRKDGKWYYFDENGNQIIDVGCDGELTLQYSYEYTTQTFSYDTYVAYLPSEDYIAINNENGGGYYDTDGNNIIPVGEFEAVRPVHDGKAWVKSDGLWGVIDLTGSISIPTETTTTTTTTESTTTATTVTVATSGGNLAGGGTGTALPNGTATAIGTGIINTTTATRVYPAGTTTVINPSGNNGTTTALSGNAENSGTTVSGSSQQENNSNNSNNNSGNNSNSNSSSSDSTGKSSPKTSDAGVGIAVTGIAVAMGMAFIARKKKD